MDADAVHVHVCFELMARLAVAMAVIDLLDTETATKTK